MAELEEITDELILAIFSNFDAPTLLSCAQVCKRWYDVSSTQSLWKKLVLKTWPSQKWLYKNIPASSLNWPLIYREFTEYSWYSTDDMQYFTFCMTAENEPIAPGLRKAMLDKMNSVKKKWTQFEMRDHNEDMVNRYFDQNMELLFNTQELKWVFLDKRRGYLKQLFKKNSVSKEKYYIRPYTVIPSCLLMYRWLCMFRKLANVETGLTFYRIWRFRLKHVETGLVFELCDWKAAMSSTFSNGKPNVQSFLNDALELLQLLTHPQFIMHPLGLHPRVQRTFYFDIKASAGGCVVRSRKYRMKTKRKTKTQKSPGISPTSNNEFNYNNNKNDSDNVEARNECFPDIDEKLEKWRSKRRLALMAPMMRTPDSSCYTSNVTSDTELSTTELDEGNVSDTESEYEYGYATNCSYYISGNQSLESIEEQHTLQASIADNWMYTADTCAQRVAIVFDLDEENWYFQSEKDNFNTTICNNKAKNNQEAEEEDIIGNAVKKLFLQIPSERFVSSSTTTAVSSSTTAVSSSTNTTPMMSPPLYFDYYSSNFQAIPSSLALYRLICLFDIDSSLYYNPDKNSVWNFNMLHKRTGGVVNFVDYNGMFQVYASTAEITVPQYADVEDYVGEPISLDGLLSEFRASVTQLLDLLMNDDFCHPYGTVAGAVA